VKNNKICIIGLGYIGLPTACLLANEGFQVVGVDINESAVNQINSGNPPIQEPLLNENLTEAINNNNFRAVTKIESADIFIICVPTPFINKENAGPIPKPDLSFLYQAVDSLIPVLKDGNLIILESTSPVGTTEKLGSYIFEKGLNLTDLHIGYCPERVLPGNIFHELVHNDRIVGGINATSNKHLLNFYKSFVKGDVIETDSKTAEMCKLSENSFRDTNIAFANSLSIICDEKGIDVWNLISLANRHPRVNILNPGPGVGGHCIAVDPWFLISDSAEGTDLIHQSRQVNDSKPLWVYSKIINIATNVSNKKKPKPIICCFGLTFKPDIDDIRESPAMKIYSRLQDDGYKVKAVDPNLVASNLHDIDLITIDEAMLNADVFVILVKHKEFLENKFIENIKTKNYLDFCGLTST
jgi:UDP-N-acetyl-D-mannosaminuronic acid dehydrogenase